MPTNSLSCADERARRSVGGSRLPAALATLALALLGGCRSSATQRPDALVPGALAGTSGDADIRLLASDDFVARSRAAERLVETGAAALPALGAAGDQAHRAPGSEAESTTSPVIAVIVARLADADLGALLDSPHAVLRRSAATEAGRRGTWGSVPQLIERLADTAPGVRDAAHAALRRITGELEDPLVPGALARASRLERWRTWWRQEGRLRAAPEPERDAG